MLSDRNDACPVGDDNFLPELVAQFLSDRGAQNRPVHTRKRFTRSKSQGSFVLIPIVLEVGGRCTQNSKATM